MLRARVSESILAPTRAALLLESYQVSYLFLQVLLENPEAPLSFNKQHFVSLASLTVPSYIEQRGCLRDLRGWAVGQLGIGSKSKHREMETYETNPDFARASFLRNTKSAALGVSGFEKRNITVPRAVSPAIRLDISFQSSGMWGVTGETGRRREQAKY